MEERQVYISFEDKDYRFNKASLLICKADIIILQKSLARLHAIRSTKKRLIVSLLTLIASSQFVVNRLDEKMPDSSMPRNIKINLDKKTKKVKNPVLPREKTEKIIKIEELDLTNLDNELLELNKRIKALTE